MDTTVFISFHVQLLSHTLATWTGSHVHISYWRKQLIIIKLLQCDTVKNAEPAETGVQSGCQNGEEREFPPSDSEHGQVVDGSERWPQWTIFRTSSRKVAQTLSRWFLMVYWQKWLQSVTKKLHLKRFLLVRFHSFVCFTNVEVTFSSLCFCISIINDRCLKCKDNHWTEN